MLVFTGPRGRFLFALAERHVLRRLSFGVVDPKVARMEARPRHVPSAAIPDQIGDADDKSPQSQLCGQV